MSAIFHTVSAYIKSFQAVCQFVTSLVLEQAACGKNAIKGKLISDFNEQRSTCPTSSGWQLIEFGTQSTAGVTHVPACYKYSSCNKCMYVHVLMHVTSTFYTTL